MDLPSIDLNLLVALHALLTERNVTRAGESIGLSQPATSAALGRLRRHFGDELLTKDGQRFVLTPLATSLLDQSEIALRYLEHTFAARPVFTAHVTISACQGCSVGLTSDVVTLSPISGASLILVARKSA